MLQRKNIPNNHTFLRKISGGGGGRSTVGQCLRKLNYHWMFFLLCPSDRRNSTWAD